MTVASLIATPSELIDSASNKCAVVLMTRIRLARNLALALTFAALASLLVRHRTGV